MNIGAYVRFTRINYLSHYPELHSHVPPHPGLWLIFLVSGPQPAFTVTAAIYIRLFYNVPRPLSPAGPSFR